jgi:hypothetical protein
MCDRRIAVLPNPDSEWAIGFAKKKRGRKQRDSHNGRSNGTPTRRSNTKTPKQRMEEATGHPQWKKQRDTYKKKQHQNNGTPTITAAMRRSNGTPTIAPSLHDITLLAAQTIRRHSAAMPMHSYRP